MKDLRSWRRELQQRLGTLWLVKMLATTLGIGAFLAAYFWVLHHQFYTVTLMPLTALDHAIAFRPEALPIYLSLWAYISLGPALLKNGRELASYGVATLAISVLGLGIFLVWPTAVPAFEIDWTQHPSMIFLKNLDLAGNACPSLHVAFAVFTAIWLQHLLRDMHSGRALHLFNWLWCIGILYSTVATRQHVVLDVLAGSALGAIAAMAHLHVVGRLGQQSQSATLAGEAGLTRPQRQ